MVTEQILPPESIAQLEEIEGKLMTHIWLDDHRPACGFIYVCKGEISQSVLEEFIKKSQQWCDQEGHESYNHTHVAEFVNKLIERLKVDGIEEYIDFE